MADLIFLANKIKIVKIKNSGEFNVSPTIRLLPLLLWPYDDLEKIVPILDEAFPGIENLIPQFVLVPREIIV